MKENSDFNKFLNSTAPTEFIDKLKDYGFVITHNCLWKDVFEEINCGKILLLSRNIPEEAKKYLFQEYVRNLVLNYHKVPLKIIIEALNLVEKKHLWSGIVAMRNPNLSFKEIIYFLDNSDDHKFYAEHTIRIQRNRLTDEQVEIIKDRYKN